MRADVDVGVDQTRQHGERGKIVGDAPVVARADAGDPRPVHRDHGIARDAAFAVDQSSGADGDRLLGLGRPCQRENADDDRHDGWIAHRNPSGLERSEPAPSV